MQQTYQRVCHVIAKMTLIEADKISPSQSLGQRQTPNHYWHCSVKGALPPQPIGFDSLDLVQLAMNLEEEFDISISDEEVDSPAIDHVGGLVAFVQGKLDAKPRFYGDIAPQLAVLALSNPIDDRMAEFFGIRGKTPGSTLTVNGTTLTESYPPCEPFARRDRPGAEL